MMGVFNGFFTWRFSNCSVLWTRAQNEFVKYISAKPSGPQSDWREKHEDTWSASEIWRTTPHHFPPRCICLVVPTRQWSFTRCTKLKSTNILGVKHQVNPLFNHFQSFSIQQNQSPTILALLVVAGQFLSSPCLPGWSLGLSVAHPRPGRFGHLLNVTCDCCSWPYWILVIPNYSYIRLHKNGWHLWNILLTWLVPLLKKHPTCATLSYRLLRVAKKLQTWCFSVQNEIYPSHVRPFWAPRAARSRKGGWERSVECTWLDEQLRKWFHEPMVDDSFTNGLWITVTVVKMLLLQKICRYLHTPYQQTANSIFFRRCEDAALCFKNAGCHSLWRPTASLQLHLIQIQRHRTRPAGKI